MFWNWFTSGTKKKKPQPRKAARARLLRIEQLEPRQLLATGQILLGGTVSVANLETSMGAAANVPVRDIHIHAWLGDNATYNSNPNPNNPSAGLNGTGKGGVCADTYTDVHGDYTISLVDPAGISVNETVHIVVIAESSGANNSQYHVIQPVLRSSQAGNYSLKANLAYASQFDDTVTSITTSSGGWLTFIDTQHDDTLTAPSAQKDGTLPAAPGGAAQTALAFTAFSILETPYDFATGVLKAKLASNIYVIMPTVETSQAVESYAILFQNNDLENPDSLDHEFGHLIANAGNFSGFLPIGAEGDHYAEASQRSQPPTTASGAIPTGAVSTSDLMTGWDEGYANYYAMACKAAEDPIGLGIPDLAGKNDETYFVGSVNLCLHEFQLAA